MAAPDTALAAAAAGGAAAAAVALLLLLRLGVLGTLLLALLALAGVVALLTLWGAASPPPSAPPPDRLLSPTGVLSTAAREALRSALGPGLALSGTLPQGWSWSVGGGAADAIAVGLAPWLATPDVERAGFANALLEAAWPSIRAWVSGAASGALRDALARGESGLSLRELTLGEAPPQVLGVKATRPALNEAHVDVSLRIAGASRGTLGFRLP
jgi:hypothetical protein